MNSIFSFVFLAAYGVAQAQAVTQRIEYVWPYTVTANSSQVNCRPASVGEGLGLCTGRTTVEVYNSPQKTGATIFECLVTWELRRDNNFVEYREFRKKVTVKLHAGQGSASFDTAQEVRSLRDPVRSMQATHTRCFVQTP